MKRPFDRTGKTLNRLWYYASGALRHATPAVAFSRYREDILLAVDSSKEREELLARANYYNQLARDMAHLNADESERSHLSVIGAEAFSYDKESVLRRTAGRATCRRRRRAYRRRCRNGVYNQSVF